MISARGLRGKRVRRVSATSDRMVDGGRSSARNADVGWIPGDAICGAFVAREVHQSCRLDERVTSMNNIGCAARIAGVVRVIAPSVIITKTTSGCECHPSVPPGAMVP